ncbi:tetraacyldisaccharide 4'-kinase [uncultured Polaribacter sp.]|uniref:tetraacyldisaccharide 4'-kinase n=1 Tax=uncultured Polaribacter sp. TaxID=174711 RepID=UPI0026315920|nr:tetraacyldisaccharide 4'-kinase [uncultured Polaribacter sp.]
MKFLRFLLFPFSILYFLITSIRNILFNIGVLKETSFDTPIIIVGNLSVGGTGKTPQIEYLVRLLKNNFKVSVLSRGYKRKTKGYVLVDNSHTFEDVGDEPLQYFKKFSSINVAVNENRVEGVQKLLSEKEQDVILLDDAFQHRKIKGSFYILLTKFNDLFVDDYLLPTGNLRESRSGANRADVIIVTKCPLNLEKRRQKVIRNRLLKFNKPVFFTSISYANTIVGEKNININDLKKYQVLLITGIANPLPLVTFLEEKEVFFKHLEFSDHHNFTEAEIVKIENEFNTIKGDDKIILTTEKDYTRLFGKVKKLNYIEIETVFLDHKNEEFNDIFNVHIQENQC